MNFRAVLVLASVLAMLAVTPVIGDQDRLKNADDTVAGHPELIYADLVRQLVPDLELDADGRRLAGHFRSPPRHLAGEEFRGAPSEPLILGFIEDKRILVGGKKRIALLVDLGNKEDRIESLTLLMLFDDEGKSPRLLDAADVGMDKDTVFADQAVLPLGPGDSALVTWSDHNSASITMGGYMIVSPIGDQLTMVTEFPLISAILCSWKAIETARFATVPDPGGPLRRIEATVTATISNTRNEGCNDERHPAAKSHVFRATWSWNAARRRFEGAAPALGNLKALNKQLFE
ncbi:MAG: hypothetical protein U1E60_09600 [Reyranellaceae bacterium]